MEDLSAVCMVGRETDRRFIGHPSFFFEIANLTAPVYFMSRRLAESTLRIDASLCTILQASQRLPIRENLYLSSAYVKRLQGTIGREQ
jgi:hypothetical protein